LFSLFNLSSLTSSPSQSKQNHLKVDITEVEVDKDANKDEYKLNVEEIQLEYLDLSNNLFEDILWQSILISCQKYPNILLLSTKYLKSLKKSSLNKTSNFTSMSKSNSNEIFKFLNVLKIENNHFESESKTQIHKLLSFALPSSNIDT